jgi:hypothetical protein
MNQTAERFYIYQGDEREMVVYPSLGQASIEWAEAPDTKKVVQVDAEGRVIRVYSKEECQKAAQDFMARGRS